jgi:hypothetical protein
MAGRPKGYPKTGGRQKGVGNRPANWKEVRRKATKRIIQKATEAVQEEVKAELRGDLEWFRSAVTPHLPALIANQIALALGSDATAQRALGEVWSRMLGPAAQQTLRANLEQQPGGLVKFTVEVVGPDGSVIAEDV